MQNEQTLKDLGFQKNSFGEWFWRGHHHTFTAKVVDCNGPVIHVDLFKVSKEIDARPLSHSKGRHYQTHLKQCLSEGSIKRALQKYDTAELLPFTGSA